MVCGVNMWCFISVQKRRLDSVWCRVVWRNFQARSLFVPILQHISFYTKNVIFGNVLFVCQVLPSCPSRVQIWAWYDSAHKLIRCWMGGVDRLFAAALCSRVLGTGSHQLISHALCNELVLTFGFFEAWCVWSTSHWVSDIEVFGFAWVCGKKDYNSHLSGYVLLFCYWKNNFYSVSQWQHCSFSLSPVCKELIPCAALCVCE